MTRIPAISSCRNAFRFELFFLKSCQPLCERFSKKDTPNIMIGRLQSEASPSLQSLISIMAITAIIVIASGIRVVTLFDSTFFNELTSPIIRERIFPVGLPSKNPKPKVCICSYSCCLILSTISLLIFAIRYILTFIRITSVMLSTAARIQSFTSPSVLFPIICTFIARSMISGLTIVMQVLIPMITKTRAISPLYLNRYLNSLARVFALLFCSRFSSCFVALRDIFTHFLF